MDNKNSLPDIDTDTKEKIEVAKVNSEKELFDNNMKKPDDSDLNAEHKSGTIQEPEKAAQSFPTNSVEPIKLKEDQEPQNESTSVEFNEDQVDQLISDLIAEEGCNLEAENNETTASVEKTAEMEISGNCADNIKVIPSEKDESILISRSVNEKNDFNKSEEFEGFKLISPEKPQTSKLVEELAIKKEIVLKHEENPITILKSKNEIEKNVPDVNQISLEANLLRESGQNEKKIQEHEEIIEDTQKKYNIVVNEKVNKIENTNQKDNILETKSDGDCTEKVCEKETKRNTDRENGSDETIKQNSDKTINNKLNLNKNELIEKTESNIHTEKCEIEAQIKSTTDLKETSEAMTAENNEATSELKDKKDTEVMGGSEVNTREMIEEKDENYVKEYSNEMSTSIKETTENLNVKKSRKRQIIKETSDEEAKIKESFEEASDNEAKSKEENATEDNQVKIVRKSSRIRKVDPKVESAISSGRKKSERKSSETQKEINKVQETVTLRKSNRIKKDSVMPQDTPKNKRKNIKQQKEHENKKQKVLEKSKSNLTFEGTLKKIEIQESLNKDFKNSNINKSSLDSKMDVEETPAVDLVADSPVSSSVDSCQVSAAASPIPKDLLVEENSSDAKSEESKKAKKAAEMKAKRQSLTAAATAKRMQIAKEKKQALAMMDEETRMSATNGAASNGLDNDDSQSSFTTSRGSKKFRSEIINPDSAIVFNVEKVIEYQWPLDLGEHYFLQEHISQYLNIMSFRRKYSDLRRRPIESQEKEYLKSMNYASEIACDLGLTAVKSEDILDILFSDFPQKYEELTKHLRDKKDKLFKAGKVDYAVVDLDKSKMQEYSRKAAMNAAQWNAEFNKKRNEEKRYCFDLQTFTVHSPVSRHKILPPHLTKVGSYPVAVLPGQYVDNVRTYSSEELKTFPLQKVLLGPFKKENINNEVVVETNEPIDCTDAGAPKAEPTSEEMALENQSRCKVCSGNKTSNKEGNPEPLIACSSCKNFSHLTCLSLSVNMVPHVMAYDWQCMDCKTCCNCKAPDHDDKMIFCDLCDRSFHTFCLGLRKIPQGRWHCKVCAMCHSCGSKTPAGNEINKQAEWQHEYRRDTDKQIKYAVTLCLPCDKYWKRRQFCSVCLKVYKSIPEDGIARCSNCPKYVHREKCAWQVDNEKFCKDCYSNRNAKDMNRFRIIAAARRRMESELCIRN